KRAILFRTDEPFAKIVVNLTAPGGGKGQKLEFLADGQQIVVDGIHPDTHKPYAWHGGTPLEIKRKELPYVREEDARDLVETAAELLCRDCGYGRAAKRPKKEGNGQDRYGPADWGYLAANIITGHEWHDSLRDLPSKLVASGMSGGAAVNLLRGLMQRS